MESVGLVLDALGRVRDMVRNALTDLSPEQLLARPNLTSPGWSGISRVFRMPISQT